MKATGIVRRIDELGRVVVPKELRRMLRLREGDPIEIFTDREGGVILKKYSQIREFSKFASEYSDSLQQIIGNDILISDRDNIISGSGINKKEYLEKKVSADLEKVMEGRKTLLFVEGIMITIPLFDDEEFDGKYSNQVISPIISEGDVIGTVIIASREEGQKFSDLQLKLAETAALFLGKQIES
ncbi:MAG: AbrB family transcriptional regulator (stage V sporulation protein T) [Clostridium sp.]